MDRERTLLILSGAKAWPKLTQFQAATAFANTARAVKNYFTSEEGPALLPENILDLFGKKGAVKHYQAISRFLTERTATLGAKDGRDVLIIFWYIGHGAFFGPDRDYCLLLADTEGSIEAQTSLQTKALAAVLRDRASQSARLLVLDCCFAGVAFQDFQGGLEEAVGTKASEAVATDKSIALLCAASAKNPAKLKDHKTTTLFGGALLEVLLQGDPNAGERLTIREVCRLVASRLAESGHVDPPRPEVHSPDQARADLASRPLFPNSARNIARDVAQAIEGFLLAPRKAGVRALLELEQVHTSYILGQAIDGVLDKFPGPDDFGQYMNASFGLCEVFEDASDAMALTRQLSRFALLLASSKSDRLSFLLVRLCGTMRMDLPAKMNLCHSLATLEEDYNFREKDWPRLDQLVADAHSIASVLNDAIIANPAQTYEELVGWLADERGLSSSHDPAEANVASIARAMMCHTVRVAPQVLFDVLARSLDASEIALRDVSRQAPELALRECRRWLETRDQRQMKIAVTCASFALPTAKDPDTRDGLLALVREVYDAGVPGSGRYLAFRVLLGYRESVGDVITDALAALREGSSHIEFGELSVALSSAPSVVLPGLLEAVDRRPGLAYQLTSMVVGVRIPPDLDDAVFDRVAEAYRSGNIESWMLKWFANDPARDEATRRRVAAMGIALDD